MTIGSGNSLVSVYVLEIFHKQTSHLKNEKQNIAYRNTSYISIGHFIPYTTFEMTKAPAARGTYM